MVMFKHVAGIGSVEMTPEEEASYLSESEANDPVIHPPNLGAIDQSTLNAALASEGSVVRGLALVVLDIANGVIPIKTQAPLYTTTQLKNLIKNKMR
jgi:hypothetical protein